MPKSLQRFLWSVRLMVSLGVAGATDGPRWLSYVGGDDARKMADEFGGFVATDLMNLPNLHAIARVGQRDASFNLDTQFIPEPDRSPEEAYLDILERTRKRYGTPKAEIRKDLEALREFLPKRKALDPFAELLNKQKKERKDREEKTTGEERQPDPDQATRPPEPATHERPPTEKPSETPAEAIVERPKKPKVTPRATASAQPLPTEAVEESVSSNAADEQPTDAKEPIEPPERKSAKAEAIKNAIIRAAGRWGFSYQTEYPLRGGGRTDIVLTLQDRTVACEISATTTPEQEVAHLLNCLAEGFTEIVCACNATVRRNRIESLLTSRLMPGQAAYFHFCTVRQLQARLADIGQAVQKSQPMNFGSKAPVVAVTVTRDEQETLAQQMLAEIAERRAKAKAAKVAKEGNG